MMNSLRSIRLRALAPASLVVLLAACSEQEAAGFERAADSAINSFFTAIFMMFLWMFLIAAVIAVLWAMIFAGAATALIAGIKRLGDGRNAQQPAAEEGTRSAAPDTDWAAVALIIFGVVLLIPAAPMVLSFGGPFGTGGVNAVPLPLIAGAIALIWWAARRLQRPAGRPEQAGPAVTDATESSRSQQ